ncbi:MAG: hypothetical protein RJQ04_19150 [Longimicrobiales bacterium]
MSRHAEPGLVVRWTRLVRRRGGLGLGVFAAVVGGAALLLILSRPVYRAEARLRLSEPPPSGGLSPTAGAFSLFRPGGDPFANDLEVLASRSLAEAVVRGVALNAELQAPRGWHRDSLFVSIAAGDSTIEGSYELTWTDTGTVTVRRTAPRDSLVGEVAPGRAVRFDGVEAVPRERRPGGPASVVVTTVPFDEAVRETSGALDVSRARREANVLDLAYAHHDPGVAGGVVSQALDAFLGIRTDLFQRESGETADSLRAVARTTAAELAVAEAALESLQRRTGLVAADAQSEELIARWSATRTALETAEAERALLETQMARVAAADDVVDAWTGLVAAPAFLDNQMVGELLTRLTALAETRTEVASRRTATSRELQAIEARVAGLDAALRSLAEEYRIGLDQRVGQLRDRMTALEARLDAVPGQAVELGRRHRDVRVLSELLVLTEQRLRQEELREALNFATVQVIDPPAVRYRPVWPRKRLGAMVGLLAGLGAAVLGMVLADAADTRLRTASEAESVGGGRVLAAVGLGGPADAGARAALPPDAVLAGCPGADPGRVAQAAAALDAGEPPGIVALRGPADAAAAARGGRPVVLVVEVGDTTREALARAAGWLAAAETPCAGILMVVPGAKDPHGVWG